MAGPVLVVRIPGTPFTLNDLRYDHGVLETARAAFETGRLVSVHDLGTHETFEMLHPEPVREAALAWAANASNTMLRQVASSTHSDQEIALPQGIRRAQAGIFEQLGDRLVSRVEPDCVLFRIAAAKDVAAAMVLATRVRAVRPRAQIFAFGRTFEDHALLTRALKLFDAISLDEIFPAREVLTATDRREWQRIHNFAYYDGARLTLTGSNKIYPAQTASTPNSDKFLYISPAEYSKLHFFDIFAVGSNEVSAVVEHTGNSYGDASTSTVSTLRSITDQFGSRAFRFRGVERSTEATLERRLLSSGMNVTFSCTLDPGRTEKTRMGLLSAAGCAAVDVDLSTGSQRLLDTYYRRNFTVTEAERLMRASKFAGIFTAAHVTYPCVEDDYHTEDETLRLIRRANPSSVVVTTEAPKAGSGLLAQEFGPFRRHARQRALKQAAQLREKVRELNIPLDIDAGTALLAGLAGYRARESEFAELVGLQLLSGDTTGLAETIERINAAAARPARTGAFRPFTAEGNAVAN